MDIFSPLIPQQQSVEDATLTKRKEQTAQLAAQQITQGYQQVINVHNAISNLVNANPYGLTPRQAAAALGTRGAALLGLAAKVQEIAGLIGQVTGRDVTKDLAKPKDGITYSAAQDGSLEVAEQV